VIRVQHKPLDVRRAEMEHACLAMIKPYDSVKVVAHEGVLFWRSRDTPDRGRVCALADAAAAGFDFDQ
jgi:hypothetical protein